LVLSSIGSTSGRVLVDAVDLAHVELDSYPWQLDVVLIRENVALARPDASKEEILEACVTVRVDEFARDLENKYETGDFLKTTFLQL
jgi:ATP-binding cassette, subfamily B, bacterial